MHYKPPKYEDKAQWVPIVVKNKDWLIGYINGIKMIENLIVDSLESNGIEMNLRGVELCLDSSRFNDIMENGEKESSCSREQIKKYYQNMIEQKIEMIKEFHPDNENIFDNCFLEVECVCGLGIYSFKTEKEVPRECFKCQVCGRTIIDYTHRDDTDFDYEGNLQTRFESIVEELAEQIEEVDEEFEEDDEDETN